MDNDGRECIVHAQEMAAIKCLLIALCAVTCTLILCYNFRVAIEAVSNRPINIQVNMPAETKNNVHAAEK